MALTGFLGMSLCGGRPANTARSAGTGQEGIATEAD